MINETIQTYVSAERARGVADTDIRSALLTQGWKPEDVDTALFPVHVPRVVPSFPFSSVASLFSGRIGRWEYLFSGFFIGLVGFGILVFFLSVIPLSTKAYGHVPSGAVPFLILLAIPIAVLSFSLSIRRLHDLGNSGWWILLNFVPFFSFILFLYLLFFRGETGVNRFGPPETYPHTLSGVWGALFRK